MIDNYWCQKCGHNFERALNSTKCPKCKSYHTQPAIYTRKTLEEYRFERIEKKLEILWEEREQRRG